MPSIGDGYSFPRIKSKRNKLGWIFSSSSSLNKKAGRSIWWEYHPSCRSWDSHRHSTLLHFKEVVCYAGHGNNIQNLLGSNMASSSTAPLGIPLWRHLTTIQPFLSYFNSVSSILNNSELPLLLTNIKHQNRWCFS